MKLRSGLFALLLSFTVLSAHAQTADEIIAKYEAAAGGREKLEGIRYLEVNSNGLPLQEL